MTERMLDERTAQWVVQATARLLATFGVVQGFFIVVGGRQRWSGAAFETALSVPGAPSSWGVTIAVLGAIVIVGTYKRARLAAIGLGGISAWCFFFSLTLLKTAYDNPLAGTSGIFTYGALGALLMLLAVTYRRGRP